MRAIEFFGRIATMLTMDFGGIHTVAKLDCLRRCLDAFASALGGRKPRLKYIDPFAGCGVWSPKQHKRPGGFFPSPTLEFEGSARIALNFKFDEFLFADKDRSSVDKLNGLRAQFPERRIQIAKAKADGFLREICEATNWEKWRGFVFLDPFGLPPRWRTMRAIARTRAIDFLLLLPPGINRLLTRNGKTTPANKALDRFCPSLGDACYREYEEGGLLQPQAVCMKVAKPHDVANYYGTQLRTVFRYIVQAPLPLNIVGATYYLWGGVGDNNGAAERLEIMQRIFSDREIRWRAKQHYRSTQRP